MTNKDNTQVSIRYSEKFYSIQGEGLYTGKPTIWLRLFSCNLNCDGFGQKDPTDTTSYILPYKDVDVNRITMLEELPVFKYGCDSSYSWSAKFKHLQHSDTPDNVAHSLHNLIPTLHYSLNNLPREQHPIHLCFTGGEPLVKPNQKQVCAVLNSYMNLYGNKMPYNITFETNGTQKITNELADILLNKELPFKVLLSYSPKLFHVSGEPAERALKPDVIKYNYDLLQSDFTLKFVLNDNQKAWDEMEEYLDDLNYLIPGVRRFVYIMPVGADKDSQDDIAGKIADMALSKGYAVSARVHAYLWNNPIGK